MKKKNFSLNFNYYLKVDEMLIFIFKAIYGKNHNSLFVCARAKDIDLT